MLLPSHAHAHVLPDVPTGSAARLGPGTLSQDIPIDPELLLEHSQEPGASSGEGGGSGKRPRADTDTDGLPTMASVYLIVKVPSREERTLQRKIKIVKVPPKQLGPAILRLNVNFSGFLSVIAQLSGTTVDKLYTADLQFVFHNPKASKPLPCGTIDGYVAMVSMIRSRDRVKRRQDAVINVLMPAPKVCSFFPSIHLLIYILGLE